MTRDATDLAGVRHERFETLGSTNAEALVRARAGERGPLWISAGRQSSGRGRRGKSWISPAGNLYATLLLSEPAAPAIAAQLSFVAGLAVHDAVLTCVPALGSELALKWPNDLLLRRRKVAGLLIEAESQPVFTVVIGFGVNCSAHPPDTSYPATDLRATGTAVEPERLLAALAGAMQERLAQWAAGAGFASTRADWLDCAASLGEQIGIRLPERQLTGVFQGIDAAGCLLLETENKTIETVAAGEVFPLGAK